MHDGNKELRPILTERSREDRQIPMLDLDSLYRKTSQGLDIWCSRPVYRSHDPTNSLVERIRVCPVPVIMSHWSTISTPYSQNYTHSIRTRRHHHASQTLVFGKIDLDTQGFHIIISSPLIIPCDYLDSSIFIEIWLNVLFDKQSVDLGVVQDANLKTAVPIQRTWFERTTGFHAWRTSSCVTTSVKGKS